MRASKRDIGVGLKALKLSAYSSVKKGDTTKAIFFLDAYAAIAGQFNFNYSDFDIESLLSVIAKKSIRTSEIISPCSDRWVLYDDFCTTYVLGLQWLEALASTGNGILYITTRDIKKENRHKDILCSVTNYSNVTTVVIPQGNILDRAQQVYDEIIRFKASKIILHKFSTQSTIDFVLPILPNCITKYLINLSDQTFWSGCRSIDYCLEFRPFGASVSVQRRGLKPNQLLMVPFYPANDQNSFMGFPQECSEGKIIVFSGGDYYKTLDENHTYWNLVKKLLQTYPQVVFLFATKNIPEGDTEIHHFISNNSFEGRFIYLQFRPDIYQVFQHCDIYMGTCPTSGSLMSQLAAINSKPILQYYSPGTPDDETEQAICINDTITISCHDEKSFFEEADKLISDVVYRQEQGSRLKAAMMQHEQFNQLVAKTLKSNTSQFPLTEYLIDYDVLDDRWYYLEKAGYINTLPFIYSLLGAKRCFLFAPSIFFKKNFSRVISSLFRI